jgi:predicted nucleic acid-binding protein
MIVAVETNFLLELALQQPEVDAADTIVRMAEAREIRLAIPAFSFVEACTKLVAQSRRRSALQQDLRIEIGQLIRSRPYRDLEQQFKSLSARLLASNGAHAKELTRIADRLRECASVIALTKEMTKEMSSLESGLQLGTGDAFVCASIHRYLKEESDGPRLFVTKDRDFQRTKTLLAAVDCQLILGFRAAVGAIAPRTSDESLAMR